MTLRHSGVLVLALAAASCAPGAQDPLDPPRDAREAALAVFALARAEDPPVETLERTLDPDRLGDDAAPAREALDALGVATRVRIVAQESLPGLDREAVDLEADLAGGGTARYSIQVEPRPDGTWRAVSVEGPGVAWPPSPPAPGEGLSTSPPP